MAPPLDPSLFDLRPEALWVMHCAVGPVPRASAQAARERLEKELRPWEASADDWAAFPVRVRAQAARLLRCDPADVTFTGSTSGGLTAVAQAFPWSAGDEVLAPLGEFPSNIWPWKALEPRGVHFREVPLWPGHTAGRDALRTEPPTAGQEPEARLLEAIGPRTRILAASWVRFQDGLKLDLARLAEGCAARGVELVVDGIQGAGTAPIPDAGFSAFATGVHKGLLAPQGVGLLRTRAAFRERLGPCGSWLSVEDGGDFRRPATDLERAWLADGRKLEQGGLGTLALKALEPSLALLERVGPEVIAGQVRELQRLLLEGLAAQPAWAKEAARLRGLWESERLGPILGLFLGEQTERLKSVLESGRRQGIHASGREGYLRIALHGFHAERDIERLLGWLALPN